MLKLKLKHLKQKNSSEAKLKSNHQFKTLMRTSDAIVTVCVRLQEQVTSSKPGEYYACFVDAEITNCLLLCVCIVTSHPATCQPISLCHGP